jgi:5S rRNA maturation endonuclease (ribonuclease M5)
MEKRVNEKTCVVEGRRDASTVEAMSAALVEREAGNLFYKSVCMN